MFLKNGKVSGFSHGWKLNPILFVHNQRCGGTALNGLINDNYFFDTCKLDMQISGYTTERVEFRSAAETLLESKKKIYLGHFFFGFSHVLDREITYLTNFRDPDDRLASAFRRFSDGRESFKEWIDKNPWQQDHLTRQLSGSKNLKVSEVPLEEIVRKVREGPIDDGDLEIAISNLKKIPFVFFLEEFIESLLMFEKKFQTAPLLSILFRRASTNKETKGDLSQTELVKSNNSMDRILFEKLRDKYETQKSQVRIPEEDVRIRNRFYEIFDGLSILENKNVPLHPLSQSIAVIREEILKRLDFERNYDQEECDRLIEIGLKNQNIKRFIN